MEGAPKFEGREVELNGMRGTVVQDYYSQGNWDCALIEYDSPDLSLQIVLSLSEMHAILVNPENETQANPPPDENDSGGSNQEAEVADESEASDSEDDTGDVIHFSGIKEVPLPPYGTTETEYMKGPTGSWYSRQDAINPGDVKLTDWIDGEYPEKYYIEKVVDERINEMGEQEYLVKFPGYELNPGVAGAENNNGDWYTKDQGVDKCSIDDFYERRRKRPRL